MDKNQTLRDIIMGPDASPKANRLANIIGGALFSAGFLGSLNAANKTKTYGQATKDVQLTVSKILPDFGVEADKADAALTADLAGYQDQAVTRAQEGLKARGISSPKVAAETATNIKAGLSGAYAAAHAALARAKLNSQSALSGAMANYQMDLADKQYKSMLSNYYAKMGIWGALGGTATGFLGTLRKTGALSGNSSNDTTDTDTVADNPGMPGTDERGGK